MSRHVLNPTFGDEIKPLDALAELGARFAGKKLSGLGAQVVLRRAYESLYQLTAPPSAGTAPDALSMVAVSPQEGSRELWGEAVRMDDFTMNDIATVFNMSWSEFIALPRHSIELMLKRMEDRRRQKEEAEAKAKEDAANGRNTNDPLALFRPVDI